MTGKSSNTIIKQVLYEMIWHIQKNVITIFINKFELPFHLEDVSNLFIKLYFVLR
jgi:hypothetical protein